MSERWTWIDLWIKLLLGIESNKRKSFSFPPIYCHSAAITKPRDSYFLVWHNEYPTVNLINSLLLLLHRASRKRQFSYHQLLFLSLNFIISSIPHLLIKCPKSPYPPHWKILNVIKSGLTRYFLFRFLNLLAALNLQFYIFLFLILNTRSENQLKWSFYCNGNLYFLYHFFGMSSSPV